MTWIKDLMKPGRRSWEEFYRNRWQHDSRVRSTHGNNCTGGCSWWVYVKEGVVGWEMQALDYPRLGPGLPDYEPRGCQRGISYSWYVYSPLRVKYPYVRGALLDLWRKASAAAPDAVAAWASIVEDEDSRRAVQQARGRGGFRRASWDEALDIVSASLLYTSRKHGPDRIVGFSPVPAMSMLSFAGGSRFLQLLGGVLLSFYDLYADFPPASPETWGEKTDVSESADWFNGKFIVTFGSNLDTTRTPDAPFAVEARRNGAKLVVLSPDFSQVSGHADWWIPIRAGMDAAFWLAVDHVILDEFFVKRSVQPFEDYLRAFSDCPFLVTLEKDGEGWTAGKLLRANRLEAYKDIENGDWKCLVMDALTNRPAMPQGQAGFRWQSRPGQWNLRMQDGQSGEDIRPLLSLRDARDDVVEVDFPGAEGSGKVRRAVPVRRLKTTSGETLVTTVFDMLMAHMGVARGLGGDSAEGFDDPERPFTPAWQEKFTGIARETVIRFAREWAETAEKTGGKCMVIIGSGANHWYHGNLNYRACITALMLCGCIGVNGGGLNHYTGQEKLAPAASWATLALALDWSKPPRLMNSPSFHYVHSDQWRYEGRFPDVHPAAGPLASDHVIDIEAAAVRLGWLPFYPQFDRNPAALAAEAKASGASGPEEIAAWVAERLKNGRLSLAVDDPDAAANWPRVWLIWRANALFASAKGHEYFLKHYLGVRSNAVAEDAAGASVRDVKWREPAPEGKLDLVVDLNFRMDTSALYSDIVLPSASWYEKNDLNTTDLHSFIHPMGEAVPPCWESKSDWEIFKALAERVSTLAKATGFTPFRDVVMTPLLHDTPDELAQPEVRDWRAGECAALPGKTMPRFAVVERDYARLYERFVSLGPGIRRDGVEDHGVRIPVADLYDAYLGAAPRREVEGLECPSLVEAVEAANVILHFAPETNGEIAYRGFEEKEKRVGLPLADLAAGMRGARLDFAALTRRPARLLTSPCWSGIMNGGRPYAAFAQNVERLVPWRTLTGRQHLYLDHDAYRVFAESLPTFKPAIGVEGAADLVRSGPASGAKMLHYLTPHGKWHMHTTYADNLRMLTLSRGMTGFWMNDGDAADIGLRDNDWVEVWNDHGVVVARSIVSARIPRGVGLYYHASEKTVSAPLSPLRGNGRAGGDNSLTRLRLKPVLMAGGYAQHTYRFNDFGPPACDRDTWVFVRRLPGKPKWE